jgi:RNA polymerase sigma-70 factor (ECF subfamily)
VIALFEKPEEADLDTVPGVMLLARCRQGDASAWRDMYVLHKHRVTRFLRFLLGPVEDVDDLVQQVFIEMVESLGAFRGESSLTTWIFSIARHTAEIHLRTEYRHDRKRQAWAEWSDVAGSYSPDPATGAEERDLARIVSDALEGMDQRHRLVWLMAEVEGLSTAEMAAALDVPAGTVRSRLFHARGEVIEALEKSGYGDARAARPVSNVTPFARRPGDAGE